MRQEPISGCIRNADRVGDARQNGRVEDAELECIQAHRDKLIHVIGFGLILLVLALHFSLIFRINIGWDEFRFLSDIYAYQRGDINNALQTIHVHLFAWLSDVGENEVDQIMVARGVYYFFLLGSCWFIFVIASRFLTRLASIFAVLVYLSYFEVIGYASTFRFDGLGVFLLLGSLALVVRRPSSMPALLGAAMLAALALMVTIKSLFYLPTLLLVLVAGDPKALWHWRLSRGLILLAAVVILFGGIYLVHNSLLPEATVASSVGMLHRVAPGGLVLSSPFPQLGYLLISLVSNIWTWSFLGLGVIILLRRIFGGYRAHEALLIFLLALPLGSLAIYRNSFPYYFVFVMPMAAVLASVPFDDIIRRRQGPADAFAASMALVVLIGFGVHFSHHWTDEVAAQRRLVEVVHEIFPEPVPYVDPSSMISSFPKVGFFMSHWGMENYHAAGQPIFDSLLVEHKPVFLLAHYPLFQDDAAVGTSAYRLLHEDSRLLRENYIHHWASIYVAGKRAIVSATEPTPVRTIIPGPYTLEAEATVFIDGREIEPGDVVYLDSGWVHLKAAAGNVNVTLRWGRYLYRPPEDPPTGYLFRGFYPCSFHFSHCPTPSS